MRNIAMSNNKHSLTLPELTPIQIAYQNFLAAKQQSEAYREKLHTYQAENSTAPNEESAAFLETMDSVVNGASQLMSTMGSLFYFGTSEPTVIEPVKMVEKQSINLPTEQELLRLCAIRDKAFFDYMRSLREEIPDEEAFFTCNESKLISAESLIEPYLRSSNKLRRSMAAIEQEITNLTKLRRDWMDFIIENFFPAFALRLLNYVTFDEMNAKNKQVLTDALNELVSDHEALDLAFQEEWQDHFQSKPPKKLKNANTVSIGKLVVNIDNNELFTHYNAYRTHHTVQTLIDFYRIACQLHHRAKQGDNLDYEKSHALEIKASHLEAIISQLEQLHPDLQEQLSHESQQVEKEMCLLDKYRSVSVLTETADERNEFLVELSEKYRTFLKERTDDHYADLYQHIHDHPQFRHETLAKETRKLLKESYPQAYQNVRVYYVPQISEEACQSFLDKYELCKFDHIVYTSIIQFMRNPTVDSLVSLELVLRGIYDTDCVLDRKFSTMVNDFMQVCSNTSVTSLAELRSEQYSVYSVAGEEAGDEVTECQSWDSRSRTGSSETAALHLTEEVLANHNQQYSSDPRMFRHTAPQQKTFAGQTYTQVPVY